MIWIVSDLGRQFTLDVVTSRRWEAPLHLLPGSISSDQIAVTAMFFGAITGAVVAGFAMYFTRSRQVSDGASLSGHSASPHPSVPGSSRLPRLDG